MSEPKRIAAVDGLRGLLAAGVFLAHFFNSAGDGHLLGLANLCVLGFFVISGYVLTRGWRGSYLGFLVRRFVRLWPLYALCIGLGGWLSMNPAPLSLYFWYPFMGHEHQAPQDPVTWSLFVEAWAMPFMPLIMWVARRPPLMLAAVAALILAQFWDHDLYYYAFFIIGSYFARVDLSVPVLESAPVQWLGRISYSLYISHVLTIGVLKFHTHQLWGWFAIPACLIVAQALCVVVENPSIALSRLAGRRVEQALAGLRGRLDSRLGMA